MALIKARTASVAACLEPVYGTIVAAFLLNEIQDMRAITGGGVILCAAAYASIKEDGYQIPLSLNDSAISFFVHLSHKAVLLLYLHGFRKSIFR